MSRRRLRVGALAAAGALVLAGCGPDSPIEIGMKERRVDILYGDQAKPPPPAPVAAADPAPGFPGFLTPPAPRQVAAPLPAPTTLPPPTTTTTTVPVACPTASAFAIPATDAPTNVPAPPVAGAYTYRQSGNTTVTGSPDVAVPAVATHTVGNVQQLLPAVHRFDVSITEGTATTVVTYEVDQRGVQDGIFIAQVRSQDEVGVDTFTPSAPVRIFATPAAPNLRWSSVGTDPLHQTSQTVFGRISGKARVDACGELIDGWEVTIGRDPQTDQPSRIVARGREVVIEARFVVATQLGGLIVFEDTHLSGTDLGRALSMSRIATINSPRPGKRPA